MQLRKGTDGESPWSQPKDSLQLVEVLGNRLKLVPDLKEALVRIEKQYLLRALEVTNGNRTLAAELLGLTYREIRWRILKHKIGKWK
jgi:DNA-binding NtrC family response regulator